MEKVIIYYTDNKLDKNIAEFCFNNLMEVSKGIPVIAVSQTHVPYLFRSILLPESVAFIGVKPKSRQSMFEQIQVGLQIAERDYQPDVVYLAEHDVLYTKDHFNFIPVRQNIFHYNLNKYWMFEDKFVNSAGSCHLSTLSCTFDLLLAHINWRLYRIQQLGMKKGGLTVSEPGCSKVSEKYGTGADYTGKIQVHYNVFPCVDIRHGNNLSEIAIRPHIEMHNDSVTKCIPYWGKHAELKEKMKWTE